MRCGAVRFSRFQNHTVRYGAVLILSLTVRCDADYVFKNRMVRCGAVRLSVKQLFSTVRLRAPYIVEKPLFY